jgi:hypothetical protein
LKYRRLIEAVSDRWSVKVNLFQKEVYGILNSSKKTKNQADSTMITQVELFFVYFLEELKTPKRHFEIN